MKEFQEEEAYELIARLAEHLDDPHLFGTSLHQTIKWAVQKMEERNVEDDDSDDEH